MWCYNLSILFVTYLIFYILKYLNYAFLYFHFVSNTNFDLFLKYSVIFFAFRNEQLCSLLFVQSQFIFHQNIIIVAAHDFVNFFLINLCLIVKQFLKSVWVAKAIYITNFKSIRLVACISWKESVRGLYFVCTHRHLGVRQMSYLNFWRLQPNHIPPVFYFIPWDFFLLSFCCQKTN